MAIAQNFPTIAPSLSLDFANVQALDPRITYARASTATYYGTRTALAEQNLLLQSQTFDNASWTKARVTATADATTAPDGTTTAELLVADVSTSQTHSIRQSVTTSVLTYTLSVYAKASGLSWIRLSNSTPSVAFAFFNISTGTIGTVGANANAFISDVGNGWYRCSINFTATAASNAFDINLAETDNATLFIGDGTSGVFLWGAQLEQRSAVTAYTVTTTQPITNYIPVLETALSGVARFDHNPTTFESLGLLVEQQSTNLMTYSDDFSNAAWTKTAVTIQSNVFVAPDGTLTMDKLVPDTGTQLSTVNTSYTPTTAIHAYSVYAKKAENRYLQLMVSGASSGYVNFDLELGTVSDSSLWSGSIQSVGNGLYRCIAITNALVATASTWRVVVVPSGTSARGASITGNGYSGIYIWGAQLEALAFPTSYIPTVASQVTRAADSASMTGTNFTSWFNNAEFSLYQDIQFQIGSPVRLGDTFANNIETIRNNQFSAGVYGSLSNTAFPTQFYSAAGSPSYPVSAFVANQRQVTAFAMSLNSFASGYSGAGATATPTYNPAAGTFSGLYFGGAILGANFTGRIRKIAYYPLRLSNTNLQALTS
jgi:hypothetical protein